MRLTFLFFMVFMSTSYCFGEVPVVARQIRAVELQRQSDESGHWLETANVIYFKTVAADQIVDPDRKAALDKIADPYRERFLNPKQADHLCGLIEGFLRQEGLSLDAFFCSVKSGILSVKTRP